MIQTIPRLFWMLATPLLCWCLSFETAYAQEECKPIRPPGLSRDQAEQVVLETISEELQIPVARIDRSRSIGALSGTDNVMLHYALVVVGISDTLAIDAARIFHKAAETKGEMPPFQSLSVAEMQSLARQAYLSSPDSPYPHVKPGAKYRTDRFIVFAPSPSNGWVMLRCNRDQLEFQRVDIAAQRAFNAVARNVSLEPFVAKPEFLTQVRAAANSFVPGGYALKSINVEDFASSGAPCALLQVQAEPASAAAGASASRLPFTGFARFCYDAKYPHLGYASLYSHVGDLPTLAIREQAISFFRGVTPTR
jgi:hypothetical protein